MKEYHAAEPYLVKSKNLYTQFKDTTSLNYYRLLSHFGILYHGKGLYAEAKHYYKMAIEGFETNPKPDWHHLASINFDLAIIYEQTGQLNEALIYFNRSMNIRVDTLKTLKEDYARTAAAIANIYQALGQRDRALRTLEYALPILKENLSENNFIYAEFLKNLASMNLEYGHYTISDSLT
ncbi:MAG: tetratricopeptide repeat protein [Saprospiraceae bacterium]|nr:tetratricopeptide repeat protein [Candidatus Vicinibacter affinis]